MHLKTMIATTALVALTAGAALAKIPLRDVAEIDRPMFSVAMAIEISDKCDDIGRRTLKGLAFLNDLRIKAKDMGYTDDEIKAYVRSDDEKARMRAMGEAYMRQKGLDPEVEANLCVLGKQEIAANSQIGAFLK
ncbi:DUF5333 domain-containing protein [Pseudooceanicola sp. C21-150M6]|uniref:DUF5333 domain-containing protein n=1 Tax=Pseudooceanicola sp. C21-150M6 TaxID=3434355 RepID=UPI003D7FDAEB